MSDTTNRLIDEARDVSALEYCESIKAVVDICQLDGVFDAYLHMNFPNKNLEDLNKDQLARIWRIVRAWHNMETEKLPREAIGPKKWLQ